MWEDEDFISYFKGHHTIWDCQEDKLCIRLRSPAEKLEKQLMSALTPDDVAFAIAGAGNELDQVSLIATARALEVLAGMPADSQDIDDKAANDRTQAQRKILEVISRNFSSDADTRPQLSLQQLLHMVDHTSIVKKKSPAPDIFSLCETVHQSLAVFIWTMVGKVEHDPHCISMSTEDLVGLLRVPGFKDWELALKPLYKNLFNDASPEELVEVFRNAAEAACDSMIDAAGGAILGSVDQLKPNDAAKILQSMAATGAKAQEVSAALNVRASSISAEALANALLALPPKDSCCEDAAAVAACLGKKSLKGLTPGVLLSLAVATTKNDALQLALPVVLEESVATAADWVRRDLVRLLVVVTQSKDALSPDQRDAAVKGLASLVQPELSDVPVSVFVEILHLFCDHGLGAMLAEASLEQTQHLSDLSNAQLLVLTRDVVEGFGIDHPASCRILQRWLEKLPKPISAPGLEGSKKRRLLRQIHVHNGKLANGPSEQQINELAQIVPATNGSGAAEATEIWQAIDVQLRRHSQPEEA